MRFLVYGAFGWCAEIIWTACYALVAARRAKKAVDLRLAGRTYLWMFPIYGAGGLLFEVAHLQVTSWPWVARGLLYMLGCFVVEAASGAAIKLATGKIPWDYSYARWNLAGLIRLDYIPVWFAFGLLLERVEVVAVAIEPVLRAAFGLT